MDILSNSVRIILNIQLVRLMDAFAVDTKAEYAVAGSCAANYSDKREGQPDYAAASVHNREYGGSKSCVAIDEYTPGHCCIL